MKTNEQNQTASLKTALIVFGSLVAIGAAKLSHAAEGERQRPDRETMHAAIEACLKEKGLKKPDKGEEPSLEDRNKMNACLAAKGLPPPPRHRHRGDHDGPPPGGGEDRDGHDGPPAGDAGDDRG